MVDRLVNSEANARRIALVESCFGSSGQPLAVPGRVLVGEGVLTKMCRKKPKARQFFLFNDILVYGNIVINKKKYNKQHIIPLEEVKLEALDDENQLRNGWLIRTATKSFAVYAATCTEKLEWMAHINKCIEDLLRKTGKKALDLHAAVWVPDSEAAICMHCKKNQFTVLNRRHHCRKCGAVVCGPCSSKRFLLPNQSSKPLRVCLKCYDILTRAKQQQQQQQQLNNQLSNADLKERAGSGSSGEDDSDEEEDANRTQDTTPDQPRFYGAVSEIEDQQKQHRMYKAARSVKNNKMNGVAINGTTLKWKAMSWRQKSRYLFNHITVEPILACYVMPSVLASMAMQNLNLEKACYVNLNYSDHVCVALAERNVNNYTMEETEVQKMVASMVVWKTALQSSLPAILILFFGSWSDRRGRRKPYLLLPIVGELFTSLGFLLCTYFFYSWPMEVAGICESLFPALTGGWMTMFMAIFSYIADVTAIKMRTFRIGIVNIFVSLGIPFGMALSGILFRQIGYYGMFSLSSFLYILGLIYGLIRIKEPLEPIPRDKSVPFLKDFFNMKHILETSRVVTRKREEGIQCRIILVMILSLLIIGPLYGESSVAYLFTRYKFNWNEVHYSMFSTYCVVVSLIGSMIAIGLLSRFFGMDDTTIGALACLGKIASSFIFAFSQSQLIFFLAPLLDMINDAGHIAIRSMATKLVPPEEQAKMNSLLGVCEAIAPLIYGPLYSFVYTQTLTIFPGAFLLLGAALTSPAFFIFVNLYYMRKRQRILNTQDKNDNDKATTVKLIHINSEDSLDMNNHLLTVIKLEDHQNDS